MQIKRNVSIFGKQGDIRKQWNFQNEELKKFLPILYVIYKRKVWTSRLNATLNLAHFYAIYYYFLLILLNITKYTFNIAEYT